MDSNQEAYANGIILSQRLGQFLSIPHTNLCVALHLFANYTLSLPGPVLLGGPTTLLCEAIACLSQTCPRYSPELESKLESSELINIIQSEPFLHTLETENAIKTYLLEITENNLITAVGAINSYLQQNNFPAESNFGIPVTMDLMEKLLGGPNYDKSVFAKSILEIAMGVINDMFRSLRCMKYDTHHWAFAAIHFALCSVISVLIHYIFNISIFYFSMLFYC